jgi:hypothetical protein
MRALRTEDVSGVKDLVVFIVRMLLAAAVMLPLTLFLAIVPAIALVSSWVAALFLPLGLFRSVSQIPSAGCRCFNYILIMIFYPLMVGLLMLIFTALISLYPCLRRAKNNHGFYDLFDGIVSTVAVVYLKVAVWLLK